jgi:hypothetical protein
MKTFKNLFILVVSICLMTISACENLPVDQPHIVDYSIYGQVSSLPENYSLLKEIINRSGLSKTLGDTTHAYTFFIQDNADFATADIYTINDLLTKLRIATPEEKNDSVLLADFIKYRSVPFKIELDSLFKATELQTLVSERKIFLSLDKSQSPIRLKFNDLNGHLTAPDAILDSVSNYSNMHCSNGIIYKINGNLWVKNRKPYRIYWDIAEQPELMSMSDFRKPGTVISINNGDLADIQWNGDSIIYSAGSIPTTATDLVPNAQYIYGDYLRFNINKTGNIKWIQFKTPVLIPGEYKVWLCYRREMENSVITTFKQEGKEDQVLPFVLNMTEYMPSNQSDEANEVEGWKFYTAKKRGNGVYMYSRLAGTINVESEGRHSLLFEPAFAYRNIIPGNWDMVQFVPVNENQLSPCIDMLGNWIDTNVESCEVFPYEECIP